MREKMPHTVAEYARHRRCSRRAVYDALRAGRIARLPGGRIDPVAADRAWKVNTLAHVGGKPRPKGAAADRRAVAAGEAEARRLLGPEAGTGLSLSQARRAPRVGEVRPGGPAPRKMQGGLV